MTKKMNKANARLAEAKAAIEQATAKLNSKQTESAKVSKPVMQKPIVKQSAMLYNGNQIDFAEPVKLSKGNWRVKAKSNGQPVEVLRRFKSITVANQWIADHVQS